MLEEERKCMDLSEKLEIGVMQMTKLGHYVEGLGILRLSI
jgi:hypothetical protein